MVSPAPETLQNHVLVVEDDLVTARVCQTYLKQGGYASYLATTGHEAIQELTKKHYNLVILDLGLPDISGFEVMDFLSARIESRDVAVIIVTGDAELSTAAKAVERGAYDYVVKPFDATRLTTTLTNAQAMLQMHRDMRAQKRAESGGIGDTLGKTVPTQLAEKIVLAASRNRATVYIVGAKHEAKLSVARSIHDQSRRRDKPFVKLDCSTIPRSAIARELFGDIRSTMPGAVGRAEEGTLFLDMVSSMPLSTQKMLVYFLTTQNYHRIGETSWRTGNCRLICATAKDLKDEMEDGHYFLGDLYFQLSAMPLFLPNTDAAETADTQRRAGEMRS